MTIILTNDDGIDAPGIRALSEAINHQGIFVAPQQEVSGCGHKVTTRSPIHVEHRCDTEYAVAGTPADCIRLAITHFCPQIDWVLSGINSGGNLGIDVYISGTVAAVREAAFHGIRGIALSQYRKGGRSVNWEQTTSWSQIVLKDLLNRPLEPGSFWNVNFPYLEPDAPEPEIVFCQPSTKPLPIDYKVEGEDYFYIGNYSQRPRTPETDVDVCFGGKIAVTLITL
ncbi:5'/3'-nucleotidase SurE [Limnoraphis robusta Tam1]|uniref:5'/3'-nucleotidase SurE n=1 Tax=Limnoraphis robusta TaxID=1118279 RepID=UPI002B21D7A4|nr:5'/3'-nucleotidase SurE [Limnoraphis robusta]MEA5542280.1 5'/3'-nucleotidase SurE [Limnoraphis robusta Tam1]